MSNDIVSRLKSLYSDGSKHAVYQNIPRFVSEALGYSEVINEEWRGDTARFSFLSDRVPWTLIQSMADIGANTGFFCLSYAHKFSQKEVKAFELNSNHVALMNEVKGHFKLSNFEAFNRTVDDGDRVDLILYLNVLHHLGADFGADMGIDQTTFVENAIREMAKLSKIGRYMAFQIGYNMWGDKSKPIVASNKPVEMFRLIQRICKSSDWKIESFGVYHAEEKRYRDIGGQQIGVLLDDGNDEAINKILSEHRYQNLSEFYKRPLLLLERV